jgi:hypothetical protein
VPLAFRRPVCHRHVAIPQFFALRKTTDLQIAENSQDLVKEYSIQATRFCEFLPRVHRPGSEKPGMTTDVSISWG